MYFQQVTKNLQSFPYGVVKLLKLDSRLTHLHCNPVKSLNKRFSGLHIRYPFLLWITNMQWLGFAQKLLIFSLFLCK